MKVSRNLPAYRGVVGIVFAGIRPRSSAWLLTSAFIAAASLDATPAAAYSPPQAAMVVDLHSGKVLYQKSADAKRYPASITKVMTLFMVFEQMKAGHLKPETKLMVSKEAASRPPSKLGLKPGSYITVGDAMHALVTKSANDVAAVVAENIAGSEEAFARMMTYKARAIGMSDTTFRNASGLPDTTQKTTARDLITLGRHVLKEFPEQSKLFRTRYFKYGERRFRNHNRLLFNYKGMEGMKTGFTRASGFNLLASCRRGQKHLLAVVLGGRSGKHRNRRMRRILDRSWSKAAALKDLKKRGTGKPIAVAGIVQSDLFPERNPAFHDIPVKTEAAEQVLQVTIRKEFGAETTKGEPKSLTTQAMASSARQPDASRDANETASEPDKDAGSASDASEPLGDDDAEELGPYHVQVGSFLDTQSAKRKLTQVASNASSLLSGHEDFTVMGRVRGKDYYRARFGKFSRNDANTTCSKLKRMKIDCLVVRVQ